MVERVRGEARKAYEGKIGNKVVSADNFLEVKKNQVKFEENIKAIQIKNSDLKNRNSEEN